MLLRLLNEIVVVLHQNSDPIILKEANWRNKNKKKGVHVKY